MIWAVLILTLGLAIAALFLGAARERSKNAEKTADDAKKNTEIAAKPFVDSPFGRMRGKK